jgi:hypothetical protein
MKQAFSSNYTPIEIENAYRQLDLPFTLDSSKINYAWKSKAILCHPDRAKTQEEKQKYHTYFINLMKARDICLSVISNSYKENLKKTNPSDELESVQESELKNEDTIEREWETFVANETKYFSSKEYLRELFYTFFKLSLHSLIVSILTTLTALEIIFLLLGFFSMAPSLPTLVWFSIPASLIFLIFYLYKYLLYLDIFILKRLTQTGYPFKYYITLWIIENIIFISFFIFNIQGALYIFLMGNFGFWIQFQRIKNKIQSIEEIIQNQSKIKDIL